MSKLFMGYLSKINFKIIVMFFCAVFVVFGGLSDSFAETYDSTKAGTYCLNVNCTSKITVKNDKAPGLDCPNQTQDGSQVFFEWVAKKADGSCPTVAASANTGALSTQQQAQQQQVIANTQAYDANVRAQQEGDNTETPCKAAEFSEIGCYIMYGFEKIVLYVVSVFAYVTSSAFDKAVDGYVLNISTLFKDSTGGDKEWVYKSWSIIRDLTNIMVVFSALYVGVRYIMGYEGENFDFKKSLIRLILTALLINFSFPIAKFLVDISNYLTLSIKGGITGYKSGGVSQVIMDYTGISKMLNDLGMTNAGSKSDFAGFKTHAQIWLTIVFLLVAGFAFLYASIMVIVRALILLIAIIFSPFMFLTSSFKSFENLNEKWRENYIGQLLFAPTLMLGFWLAIGFLQAANGKVSTTSTGGVTDVTNVSVLMPLLGSIIALVLAVKAAGKVSGAAGQMIGGLVGGAMKNVGMFATGGVAGFALRGVGAAAGSRALGGANWVKNTNSEHGMMRRGAANMMTRLGTAGENLKFTNKKLGISTKSYAEAGKKVMPGMALLNETDKDYVEKKFKQNEKDVKLFGLDRQMRTARSKEEVNAIIDELEKRKKSPTDKSKWNDKVLEEFRAKKTEVGIKEQEDNNKKLAEETKKKEEDKLIKDNKVAPENRDNFLRLEEERKKISSAQELADKKLKESAAQAENSTLDRNQIKQKIAKLEQDMKSVAPGSIAESLIKKEKDDLEVKLAGMKTEREGLATKLKSNRSELYGLSDQKEKIELEAKDFRHTKPSLFRKNKTKKTDTSENQQLSEDQKAASVDPQASVNTIGGQTLDNEAKARFTGNA